MLEDCRGHDPNPTARERAWMETNLLDAALHLAALTAVAVIVGFGASLALEAQSREAPSAVAATSSP